MCFPFNQLKPVVIPSFFVLDLIHHSLDAKDLLEGVSGSPCDCGVAMAAARRNAVMFGPCRACDGCWWWGLLGLLILDDNGGAAPGDDMGRVVDLSGVASDHGCSLGLVVGGSTLVGSGMTVGFNIQLGREGEPVECC